MPVAVLLRVVFAIAVTVFIAVAARAETPPPDDNGRYLLRKAQDGWFRVDQNTGQASLCREGNVGFTCELVPDDRDALLDEITRLAEENAMLRAQAARGGKPAELPGKPDTPDAGEKKDDGLNLPSEEELDKVMKTFRSMADRFMAMVQDLRDEFARQTQ